MGLRRGQRARIESSRGEGHQQCATRIRTSTAASFGFSSSSILTLSEETLELPPIWPRLDAHAVAGSVDSPLRKAIACRERGAGGFEERNRNQRVKQRAVRPERKKKSRREEESHMAQTVEPGLIDAIHRR